MTQDRTPTVSVLMPVRNEERSVAGAIGSVLQQTEKNLEVLVIDGQSDDGTASVVNDLASTDPRIRLLDNPNRTIPHALNIGLAAAQGRYVARVDAHASVSLDYLERGVTELEANSDVASVGGRRIGVGEGPAGRAIAAALSSPFGVGNSINHYGGERQDTDHASFAVSRKDVLRSIGGWDENLLVNEDVDLDHRIALAGFRIRYDPDMEIHWHVRRTVRDLGRQYRRYGRGKAAMVRKNGSSAVRVRHLAAPGLVAWTGGAVIALLTGHPRIATAMVAPYVAGLAGATVATRRKGYGEEDLDVVPLAGAFAAMHFGWGLGFLEGYLLRLTPAAASGRDPRKK
ncbi:MAG: succinoglycan biosynthesis protein ExoA [Actinomycetota bacterium]|nr:succinoglycan biosynthesis protein ExoA [Actinomycetota bacterium]